MKTKFIIKGLYKNEVMYYRSKTRDDETGFLTIEYSKTIDGATFYETEEDAERGLYELHNSLFKIYPVCPRCNHDYEGHPAISRYDNKSFVCSQCGVEEALEVYSNYLQKEKATI